MKDQPEYWKEYYPEYLSPEGYELEKQIATKTVSMNIQGKLTHIQLMVIYNRLLLKLEILHILANHDSFMQTSKMCGRILDLISKRTIEFYRVTLNNK